MQRTRSLLAACLVLAGCSSSTPAAGTERGPCYGNGTCNAGLVCLSSVCVNAGGDGGALDGGSDAGSDGAITADAGSDGGAEIDAASDAGLERRAYVVSTLAWPRSSVEATSFGVDVDGDGAADNALGSAVASLSAGAGGLTDGVQSTLDDGTVILLVEVTAGSFTSGPVVGRALQGGDPMPAPCTMPTDPTTCGQHLMGTGHFTATTPAPSPLNGMIATSRFDVGPGASVLPIAFSARGATWVPLVRAHVRGDVVTGGVMNGVLGGAIRQSDAQTLVVGAMLAPLTDAVTRDCPGGTCASGSTGASVLALFDANHDGMITADELRSSSLVMSVLSPDLDLFDAAGMPGTDGVNDSLSVGVGFTAVNATFASP